MRGASGELVASARRPTWRATIAEVPAGNRSEIAGSSACARSGFTKRPSSHSDGCKPWESRQDNKKGDGGRLRPDLVVA